MDAFKQAERSFAHSKTVATWWEFVAAWGAACALKYQGLGDCTSTAINSSGFNNRSVAWAEEEKKITSAVITRIDCFY
jgi:hypothetical protein